jgi:hypothetical protein
VSGVGGAVTSRNQDPLWQQSLTFEVKT